MKRAAMTPFITLVALALVALFVAGRSSTPVPTGGPINSGDVAWMLTASALVLLMTPGLSFFYGGMVGLKNVVSTMLQSVVALGVISLVWVLVGFSLAFGDSFGGLVGNPLTFFMFDGVGEATHPALSATVPLLIFALFQLKFAIITPALDHGIVRGTRPILVVPALHRALQPVHLRSAGALDLAPGRIPAEVGRARLRGGHGCPHVGRLGGPCRRPDSGPAQESCLERDRLTGQRAVRHSGDRDALVRLVRVQRGLGPGRQRHRRGGFRNHQHGLGRRHAGLDVLRLDAGTQAVGAGACIGAVVGLVAITPAAGYVSIRESILIGLFASVVSNMAAHWKSKSTLDDTLDVFPCHGVGGMVGLICTGIFAKDVGLLHGNAPAAGSPIPTTFLAHLLAPLRGVGLRVHRLGDPVQGDRPDHSVASFRRRRASKAST